MTLTKEQLDKLVGMIAECPYKNAAPIMNLLQQILQEQENGKANEVK